MVDIPQKINLGSGRDFRDDHINIDIDAYWSPDIVADVSREFPAGGSAIYRTIRFGDIRIERGAFDEIVSNDVLEHIPNLVATMTNCLGLLKVGGMFRISVPYDLSHGAWQDPTHIRAFNERSWLYYTDWYWYLGWTEHRFVLRSLTFAASPLGKQMIEAGQAQDLVVRTPRAIDSMSVTLEKISLNDAERDTLKQFAGQRESLRAPSIHGHGDR